MFSKKSTPNIPYEMVKLPKEEEDKRRKLFAKYSTEYDSTIVKPLGICLPKKYDKMAEKLYNMEVRPDDVWIVNHPNTGAAWMQEIVWNILHKIDKTEGKKQLYTRSPFLESEMLYDEKNQDWNFSQWVNFKMTPDVMEYLEAFNNSINLTKKTASPRVIKTHLPLELLPPKLTETAKVIYVARNPKDTMVSYWHAVHNFPENYGMDKSVTFNDFAEMFMKGHFCFGHYLNHLKSGWKAKDNANVSFFWYEDMKEDTLKAVKQVVDFLGKSLTDDQIKEITELTTVESMRDRFSSCENKESADYWKKYFRSGVVGDWQNYFKGAELEKVNNWIDEGLKGTEITIRDLL